MIMSLFRKVILLCLVLAGLVLGYLSHAGNETGLVQKWRREYTHNLLNNFCTTGSYFKECYGLDRERCMEEVKRATYKCFDRVAIRSSKELEKFHIFYGSKIGFCVGKKIEMERKVNRSSKQCLDPREWL